MSHHRFEDLNHYFQINCIESDGLPSITKLSPLLDLTEKFKAIYSPSNKIAIDESMCPFRGRFKHLVYEPNKPHKWDVKLINECDSATGYCLGITPYLGQETYNNNPNVSNLDERILNRCKQYRDTSYHFYCDSYYCHPNLAIEIKKLSHNITGTIKNTRKDIPFKFASSVVKKGNIKAFSNEEGVCIIKFKDKREIHILSTENSLEFVNHKSQRGRNSKKPSIIADQGLKCCNKKICCNKFFVAIFKILLQ